MITNERQKTTHSSQFLDQRARSPSGLARSLSRWNCQRRTWLITSLSPGGAEKMPKHSVPAGEVRHDAAAVSDHPRFRAILQKHASDYDELGKLALGIRQRNAPFDAHPTLIL
jgi:hypothetical protein